MRITLILNGVLIDIVLIKTKLYKKDVYSNNICEHYVTNLFLYRLHNRFCYFLYKINAKIKGIEIKEVKK